MPRRGSGPTLAVTNADRPDVEARHPRSEPADAAVTGHEALRRGDWSAAEAAFTAALAAEESAEALEGFALARWWQDDVETSIEARERAYARRRRDGDTVAAVFDAAFLAWDHGALRGADAVAQGWLLRARRLAEDLPPAGEHAWLSLIEASFHIDIDAGEVLRLSTEAEALARAHGALDGHAEILRIGGGEVGRLVFQPGWRWSSDVKPIAGTDSCQAPHFQYHVSGRIGILMDDGTELEAGPGDVTRLGAGHDGWVIGDEPAVVIDWHGASTYAKG